MERSDEFMCRNGNGHDNADDRLENVPPKQ